MHYDKNNLNVKANISATQLENAIHSFASKERFTEFGLCKYFIEAENKYSINSILLASICCLETGYVTSQRAIRDNNLFGIAPTKNPKFESKAQSIDYAANRLANQYLKLDSTASHRYLNGKKDIYSVGSKWCEGNEWADQVLSIANRIENNLEDNTSSNNNKGSGGMKFNVHGGHAAPGKRACGVVSILDESKEDRRVKDAVIKKLRSRGHTVYDCTADTGSGPTDILRQICSKANAHKVDLDVSFHFNAGADDERGNGKTTGVETLYTSSGGKNRAPQFCSNIAKLGFKSRGIKERNGLYYLNHTKNTAVLVEICFADDKDDAALYRKKFDQLIDAIVFAMEGKAYDTKDTITLDKPKEKELDTAIVYMNDVDQTCAEALYWSLRNSKHEAKLLHYDHMKDYKVKNIIAIGAVGNKIPKASVKLMGKDRYETIDMCLEYGEKLRGVEHDPNKDKEIIDL